ncbi:unnamed protein product [Cladocopium goreaui]|uniref:Uncharacterized protein n=1 Tax=Cladocopium goreaui TaxID=2562237 RepID=A0A9P1M1X0_9DINO|nr:unnamed protein product [Cladocopium goreaui]
MMCPHTYNALRCLDEKWPSIVLKWLTAQLNRWDRAKEAAVSAASEEPGLPELNLSAQLRNELAEARANAKLRDELNEANLRLADQLTEANANLREELIEVKVELLTVREGRGLHQEELEAEKQAFTHELHQLQRSIRNEMAAQTISSSSQSQASTVPSAKLREEHEQALQDLRAAKRAEASARQDLEKQRSEMRKLREAHQMDMDALAAELQQFQEEHGQLEGQLRTKEEREPALRARLEAAQAQVLEETPETLGDWDGGAALFLLKP